jgi:primosomal protein N' (replication factor Y)
MSRITLFVDVIVPLSVPKRYTYRVPEDLNEEMVSGKRVIVPFGGNRLYTGIIYALHEKAPLDYEARYVEAVIDDAPIVTEEQLKFWDWIAYYYCANPGDVMNAALPSGLKLSSTSHIQLHPEFDAAAQELSERETLLVDTLAARVTMSMDDVIEVLKIKTIQPILQKMIKKNILVIYEEVQEKFKPKLQSFVALSETYRNQENLQALLTQLEKKAFRQVEALMAYLQAQRGPSETAEWMPKTELLKKTDTSAISSLIKKGVFITQEIEISRLQFEKSSQRIKALNAEQSKATTEIKQGFSENTPVLLHGVTGSGKTEVYIQLIEELLQTGKQVLYLIPEIALTTQLIARLRAVFGEAVGVYHSRFSENERVEIWQHLVAANSNKDSKKFRIIVGARSALFLPFLNLGLIIVDEEHDSSFKQHDPSPRYHARDAALYLAAQLHCNILLGSATPSLESFQNALQKKYHLVELKFQFVSGGGTELEICDLNFYHRSNQMQATLTAPLYNAVQKALTEKKQIILFQNRRGFAPYTECKKCGHVPHCIQCDVSLIYHKQQQKLVCHYCGYSIDPPRTCAACGSNEIQYRGLGTEKIEEDIEILFPNAKIARMDLDSTRSKFAYKQLIDEFEAGQIDILIGTQMVSKGLDFKNVSVVGVLNADAIINFPDFRSFERAYQLLTQVRGRAGRNNEIGKVFIQTTQPAHKVVELLRKNDYQLFFEETLQERRQFHYPPFTRLIELNVICKDLNENNHLANELYRLLDGHFKGHVLGPEAPLIARIKNYYYKRLLLKIPKEAGAKQVRQILFACLDEMQHAHKDWKYRVSIEVDPV